ncbi:MAG: hypothetical protein AB1455_10070 [Pseudomonadota bacterium]
MMYRRIKDSTSILHLPTGGVIPMPPQESLGFEYQRWLDAGNTPEPAPVDPPPSQFELDQRRYQKRAEVQSQLIAWMAADNMSRVRSGVWTVADLTSLMSDPAVTAASDYMGKLSYELAAQAIQAAATPLLTPSIKSAWISKLQAHFYLEP